MNATLSTRQLRLVVLLVLVVVAVGGYLVVTSTSRHVDQRRRRTTPAVTTHGDDDSRAEQGALAHGDAGASSRRTGCRSRSRARSRSTPSSSSPSPRRADVDQTIGAEAQAGASRRASATSPSTSSTSSRGTAILRKLGVVDTPDVLVVKRPGHDRLASSRASSTATWSRRPSPTLADETGRPPSGSRARAAGALRPQREPARTPGRDDAGA